MKYHYEDENVKIRIYFPEKAIKLLANATVIINTLEYGFYTTKGFQIWPSSRFNDRLQEAINITPPTGKTFGFPKITYFEDKNKWYELERLIYSAYLKAKGEEGKNKQSLEENVNPDEISL